MKKLKKMINKIIYSIILIILIACKSDKRTIVNGKENHSNIEKKTLNIDCGSIFQQIIKSSNLELVKHYEKQLFSKIDEIQHDKVVIALYLNDGKQPTNTSITPIAWLEFDNKTQKLSDITNDPDEPQYLEYDKDIINRYNINAICGLIKKDNHYNSRQTSPECITFHREMETEERCVLPSTSLQKVYEDIIKNKLVDNTEYLLPTIPRANYQIQPAPELIISYEIKDKTVVVDMEYMGGVTSISLENRGNQTIRSIIHGAN